jgi:DNA primase catalytic core
MSWKIAEADLAAVKARVDLGALVRSRGIELTKHGSKDWRGRCPFHGDKETPNLIVSPAKGLFHCMACGAAGNALQFVQKHDGVSFRHAFELLRDGVALTAQPRAEQSTVPKLPCPLGADAGDAALCAQVVGYYHERLKQSPSALAYLESRGLGDPALLARHQVGFADRTLGLRLPEKNRVEGAKLRTRLTQLGLYRESGHEHFNGCVVVPLRDAAGQAVSLYGRRVQRGEPRHLYPPGPHRGLFNPAAFESPEVILCEAVLDALTFCAAGFANATCLYGTEGLTAELWERLRKARKVYLAYDADEAGDRAAERDTARLRSVGVEVARVKFPWGLDANSYAVQVQPAAKSLGLLLNGAQWLNSGAVAPPPSSLAACVSRSLPEAAAKKEALSEPAPAAPAHPRPSVSSVAVPGLTPQGEHHVLDVDGREWRVGGLAKTVGTDGLKVTLRLRVGDFFHLDQVDLARDADRRRFAERAAEETQLTPDLLRRDLGRVLLAAEQAQGELAQPAEALPTAVELSPEERAEALAWLQAPDLVGRLRGAFRAAGIIGEEHNALVAYLAATSRQLERPLAVIVQSASAAGKTTLMEAVLAFFPEEARVKYSAMTGQSLYYLGETSLQHKILAVVEEAGAEKAAYALKLLQSEGELTIASTGKDPQTGRMVTQEYHVAGPVMIFLTTTAIDLDEELQNRCLTLAVDESAAQTAAIHRAQREKRTLAGLLAREERRAILRVLRNAQRLLRPLAVVNPFAPALTFPSERTRARRDHEKYLTLIDAIALLHQRQREVKHREVQGRAVEYVEATRADIALAHELAAVVLGRTLDELPPQTRALLGHARELVKARQGGVFTRRELREACGWSLTQVRAHLDRLLDLEYVALRPGRHGHAFSYELLAAEEAAAAVPLLDASALHAYTAQVAGPNGQLAGGGGTTPPGDKAA